MPDPTATFHRHSSAAASYVPVLALRRAIVGSVYDASKGHRHNWPHAIQRSQHFSGSAVERTLRRPLATSKYCEVPYPGRHSWPYPPRHPPLRYPARCQLLTNAIRVRGANCAGAVPNAKSAANWALSDDSAQTKWHVSAITMVGCMHSTNGNDGRQQIPVSKEIGDRTELPQSIEAVSSTSDFHVALRSFLAMESCHVGQSQPSQEFSPVHAPSRCAVLMRARNTGPCPATLTPAFVREPAPAPISGAAMRMRQRSPH